MKEELERTLKIKAFDSSGSLLAFTAFAGLCSAAFLAPTPAASKTLIIDFWVRYPLAVTIGKAALISQLLCSAKQLQYYTIRNLHSFKLILIDKLTQ